MTLLLATLILGAIYALCRVITLARRAGYLGFWAFGVWALLLISREAFALAEGIREGQRHKAERREAWNRTHGFGEVGS